MLNNSISIVVLAMTVLFTTILHAAPGYYADSSKSDDSGDGISWATAKKTIQAAIDLANTDGSVASPVEVWVKGGVYTPPDQSSSFVLKPYVKLYGGFDGTETALEQRDYKKNHTILSCDLSGDDQWIDKWGVVTDGAAQQGLTVSDSMFISPEVGWVLDKSTAMDNCGLIVSIPEDSNLDDKSTFDGFIVTGGYQESSASIVYASGIRNSDDNSILSISNCVVSGNTIFYDNTGNVEVFGSGIGSYQAGNTINIANCTIQANLVSMTSTNPLYVYGAGISNLLSSLTVMDSDVGGNAVITSSGVSYTYIYGVGVYNSGDDSSITGSSFRDNMGHATATGYLRIRGGAIYSDADNLSLSDCQISSNVVTANSFGSNVYVYGGGIFAEGNNTVLLDSEITGNTAKGSSSGNQVYSYGGGIYITGDNATLLNTEISNNTVPGSSTGSYVYSFGGGISAYGENTALTNCAINNNSVAATSTSTGSTHNARTEGGGGYFYGYTEIVNCTVSGNSASASSRNSDSRSYGGGVSGNGGSGNSLLLVNSTLSDNSASSSSDTDDAEVYGGGLYNNLEFVSANVINTILWNNTISASAVSGTATAGGPQVYDAGVTYSVVENGYAGGNDIIVSEPLLQDLGDNGGPTETQQLGGGSSAINAGVFVYQDTDDTYFYAVPSTSDYKKIEDNSDYSPTSTDSCLNTTDQRGASRPQSSGVDIGAYELGGSYTVTFAMDSSRGGSLSGSNPQTVTYFHNSSAVEAVPIRRYEFSGWTGDYTGTDNPLILGNIDSDMNIQANFTYVGPDFPWVLFYPAFLEK